MWCGSDGCMPFAVGKALGQSDQKVNLHGQENTFKTQHDEETSFKS